MYFLNRFKQSILYKIITLPSYKLFGIFFVERSLEEQNN